MPASSSLPAVYPRAVPHRMKHAYARGRPRSTSTRRWTSDSEKPRGRKRGPSAPSPPQARRDAGPRARVAGVARGISRFRFRFAVARWQSEAEAETETEFEAEAFVVIRSTDAGIADCLNCRGPGRSGDYGLCQAVEYRNAGGTKWVCWCG